MFAVSRKNFMLTLLRRHCSNLLGSTKRRAQRTFVIKLVDGGNTVVDAGAIRGVEKRVPHKQNIGGGLETAIASFAPKHMISSEIGFFIGIPGHDCTCFGGG